MAAKKWGPDDDAEMIRLGKFPTEELVKQLEQVGGRCTALEKDLFNTRHQRTLLFLVLEKRDVPYRRMAQIAGGITDVAILRSLQRVWMRRNPEPVV